MKKRGAGWIPDYPDQSDYTLEKDSKKLSKQVQSQGSSASIESLAKNVCKALDVLSSLSGNNDQEDLKNLRESIELEILDGYEFITADFYELFKVGTIDLEVLSIRNCLLGDHRYPYKFLSGWMDSIPDPINMELTDDILKCVNSVVASLLWYVDLSKRDLGSISFEDMVCLNYLYAWTNSNYLVMRETYKNWGDILDGKPNFFEVSLGCTDLTSDLQNDHKKVMSICTIFMTHNYRLFCSTDSINTLFNKFLLDKGNNLDELDKIEKGVDALISKLLEELKAAKDKQSNLEALHSHLANSSQEFHPEIATSLARFLESVKNLYDSVTTFKNCRENGYVGDEGKIESFKEFGQSIVNNSYPFVNEISDQVDRYFMPPVPSQFFSKKERLTLGSPIHSDLHKLIEKELVYNSILKKQEDSLPDSPVSSRENFEIRLNKYKGKFQKIQSEFDNLIKPIIDVVAQMLMPLSRYGNLDDAVIKALEGIRSLLGEETVAPELRQLIQELLKQQGISPQKDITLLNEFVTKEVALNALQQTLDYIKTHSKDIDQSFDADKSFLCNFPEDLSENCHLVKLIKLIETTQSNGENEENISLLLKNLRQKQSLIYIDSKANLAKSRKKIQFPISQKLRTDIFQNQNGVKDNRNQQNGNQGKENSDVYLTLPEFVDLSYCCSPIEDQGGLNSCTAHAGIALLEYSQRKSSDTYVDVSPLFLYKVTRNLMQKDGDSGASMRDTMKAMVAFGVCPEEHWSYDEADFDLEPPAFCYSFAESFKALKYFRLDHGTISKSTLLAQVKVLLASEIPCAFGFTLYSSVYEDSNFDLGHIPLPTRRDKVVGGHVVVAVGYHDRKIIKNSNGDEFEGALLIRNSWGSRWGQGGYGWMPYEYVIKGLTADWWSLLKAEWLASGSFGAGASAWDRNNGFEVPGGTG